MFKKMNSIDKIRQVVLIFIFVFALSIGFYSCDNDDNTVVEEVAVWDKTPYNLVAANFPPANIKADNLLTIEGVKLGRMLFYETKLSKDNSIVCGSCHKQENAFTDTARLSKGVGGSLGLRNSMSAFNMAWNRGTFFWDGRAEMLRNQALMPIQDHLEMNETLPNVIAKLSADKNYKNQFIRAFGTDKINDTLISFALEQFMYSIVSNNSKYDKFLAKEVTLTESEERGRKLFFTEYDPFMPANSGADCAHCHGGPNFDNPRFHNNGLFTDAERTDNGLEKTTKDPKDIGKFKTVTLRNITLTAPYMHNGQFKTLREVINHYNSGLKPSQTLDPALERTRATGLKLTDSQIDDLIAFLKTLEDPNLLTNQAYSNPFK